MKCFYNIYKDFTDGITMCEMNYRLSKKIIENQQKQIKNDYKKLFEENKTDIAITTDCMSFYPWKDPNFIEQYGKIDTTLNSYWEQVIYYHNKLYQWQLVTAFEHYEKYLKEIIKILCSETKEIENPHAKIKNQFPKYKTLIETKIQQKINIEESQKKPSEGLISYQKTKNGTVKTIHDPCNYDHEFTIFLIEQFRHYVVHCNGKIQDKKAFIQKILKKIGKYNEGKYDQMYDLVLNAYLNEENEIQLLEIPNLVVKGFIAETTVLGNLFSVLLNSAYYIYKETKEKNVRSFFKCPIAQ